MHEMLFEDTVEINQSAKTLDGSTAIATAGCHAFPFLSTLGLLAIGYSYLLESLVSLY